MKLSPIRALEMRLFARSTLRSYMSPLCREVERLLEAGAKGLQARSEPPACRVIELQSFNLLWALITEWLLLWSRFNSQGAGYVSQLV